jgi:hypothetical protein
MSKLINLQKMLKLRDQDPGYDNAPESKKPLKAPAAEFALTPERAASPQFKADKADQDETLRQFVNAKIEAKNKQMEESLGLPSNDDELAAGIKWGQIQDAGQMAGSIANLAGKAVKYVAPVIAAENAAEGVAKASVTPGSFGRIINTFNPQAKFVAEKVIPKGKVLRARK